MSPSHGGHPIIGTFWKDFPQTLNILTWIQLETDPELNRLYPLIVSNYTDNNFLNDNWRNIILGLVRSDHWLYFKNLARHKTYVQREFSECFWVE